MNSKISISLGQTTLKCLILSLFFLFLYGKTNAQKPLNPIQDNGPKSKIELMRADSLVGENSLTRTQTFLGNVIFLHRGVRLGCDKAVHNLSSNFIEAYGHIVVNQGDTLTIVGDTLMYDGNMRIARVFGKQVILRDKKVTLRTTKIFYDLNRDQAYYPVPGVLNQDSSKLSSKEGYYNTKTKFFRYIGDVEILNPNYTLCTDSLDYDTYSKQAIFKTFTTIKSKNGDLSAYKGKYNIKTKVSYFEGRAKVANVDYSLEGDTLNFDNSKGSGTANGNVVFVSFMDSLVVVGNKGLRIGESGLTKIMGETVAERISQSDTLLISSDTLYVFEKQNLKDTVKTDSLQKKQIDLKPKILVEKPAVEKPVVQKNSKKKGALQKKEEKIAVIAQPETSKTDTTTNKAPKKKDIEKIIADGHVKIFRKEFQSLSDSLIYNLKDSLIFFYQNPIIWNGENQLEADTMIITLKNDKLKLMRLIQNSFVVQVDTIKNFNQIKGRKINAIFDNNAVLETIKVEGNGESVYFALDDKNKIIGLNKVQCSTMQFYFKEKKIKQIVFRGKPESLLVPPKEITKEDMKLEKFEWKVANKPTKEIVIGKKFSKALNDVKFQ